MRAETLAFFEEIVWKQKRPLADLLNAGDVGGAVHDSSYFVDHIAHAKSLRLPYVYLGYWIEGSRKMNYKNRFQPQERLTSKGWVRPPMS